MININWIINHQQDCKEKCTQYLGWLIMIIVNQLRYRTGHLLIHSSAAGRTVSFGLCAKTTWQTTWIGSATTPAGRWLLFDHPMNTYSISTWSNRRDPRSKSKQYLDLWIWLFEAMSRSSSSPHTIINITEYLARPFVLRFASEGVSFFCPVRCQTARQNN